jgi:hypothetical protein
MIVVGLGIAPHDGKIRPRLVEVRDPHGLVLTDEPSLPDQAVEPTPQSFRDQHVRWIHVRPLHQVAVDEFDRSIQRIRDPLVFVHRHAVNHRRCQGEEWKRRRR